MGYFFQAEDTLAERKEANAFGEATMLLGIQEIPGRHSEFIISNLDDNGTIYFSYKDSVMVLLPNGEWSSTSSEIKEEIEDNGEME